MQCIGFMVGIQLRLVLYCQRAHPRLGAVFALAGAPPMLGQVRPMQALAVGMLVGTIEWILSVNKKHPRLVVGGLPPSDVWSPGAGAVADLLVRLRQRVAVVFEI